VDKETVFQMIDAGTCPTCLGTGQKVKRDLIDCKICGTYGIPSQMKWCLKVPVFNPVPDVTMYSGQLFKDINDLHWKMMGYAPGCGREVKGNYCTSCRAFLPLPVDHPARRSRAKSARAETRGKDAASGDD
jgi:hypothetical protein